MIDDTTLEEQELLAVLHARMVTKTRYTPPLPEEAHLYEMCFTDMDYEGTTIYSIPTWLPKAECEVWEEIRWRPRWHEIGHA